MVVAVTGLGDNFIVVEIGFDREVIDRQHGLAEEAAQCLFRDRDELLTFYGFPAKRWVHIRTKGNGSRKACLARLYKLIEFAQKRWRRRHSHAPVPQIISDVHLFQQCIDKQVFATKIR